MEKNHQRRYEYSPLFNMVPTSRAGFVLAFLFLASSFTIGGAIGLPAWLILVPIAILIIAQVLQVSPFIRRRRGMRAAAERLGLSYSQRDDEIGWLPPWPEFKVKERRYFNVLRGRFDDTDVVVLDASIRTPPSGPDSEGRTRGGGDHRFFSVVRMSSSVVLPRLLIKPKYLFDMSGAEIPGTGYYLFNLDGKQDQPRRQFVTRALQDYLAKDPGLVINSDGQHLTVYCYRSFPIRRQVPTNLPAFLEDVLQLRQRLSTCRQRDLPGTDVTIEPAILPFAGKVALGCIGIPILLLFGSLILGLIFLVCSGFLSNNSQVSKQSAQKPGQRESVVRQQQPASQEHGPQQQPVSLQVQFKDVIQHGSPQELQAFLDAHPDDELLTMHVSQYGLALHHAVVYNRTDTVALLLDSGADVNAQGKNGQTALYLSCRMHDRLDIARLLLERGADPSIKSSMGYTARQQARFTENTKAIEILDEFAAKTAVSN